MGDARTRRGPSLLQRKAEQAMKKAVAGVIRKHQRTGDPLAIWQNGRVAWVSADRLLKRSKKR